MYFVLLTDFVTSGKITAASKEAWKQFQAKFDKDHLLAFRARQRKVEAEVNSALMTDAKAKFKVTEQGQIIFLDEDGKSVRGDGMVNIPTAWGYPSRVKTL